MAKKPKITPHGLAVVQRLKDAIRTHGDLELQHLTHHIPIQPSGGRASQTYTIDLFRLGSGRYEATCREMPKILVIGAEEHKVLLIAEFAIRQALEERR